MAFEEIRYEVADRIATITLHRPDKLNAWTSTMEAEVREAMLAAEADENVRVIILTGAGRGFCAGADMSLLSGIAGEGLSDRIHDTLHGAPKTDRTDVRPDFLRKHSYFVSIGKPIIAAINGAAAGLGFILPFYCDLRFASDQAKFSTAFAKRGLIAEYGIAWLLPRLVGTGRALDILYSARLFDAAEAKEMGLVNRVFPAATFLDEVRAYARDLADNVSPRSLRVIKQQVYNGLFQTLGESMDEAQKAMIQSLQSEDFKEGVAHFLEKRAPQFTGR
jgi:enoyl-CoA hydratase/carnithine racemase